MCKGKCEDCYQEVNIVDQKKPLDFVFLSNDQTISKGCKLNKFFDPYNFESAQLKTSFQGQSLANHRKIAYPLKQYQFKNNNLFFNRNLLPAIVMNIDQISGTFEFNVKIRLSDIQHVGISSLVGNTNYQVRFYSVKYDDCHQENQNLDNQNVELTTANVKLITESILQATGSFVVKSLKISQYLIEVGSLN
jgi:hypothetical protein